jgi:hypothetical protein
MVIPQNYTQGLHSWLSDGENHSVPSVLAKGVVVNASGAFVRPNNTTSYSTEDAVSDSVRFISFPNAIQVSGAGVTIVGAGLVKSSTALTDASFRLWVYKDTPAASPTDNVKFGVAFTDRFSLIGYADFDSPISGSNCTRFIGTLHPSMLGPCKPTGTSLYGVLQAMDSYVPTASEEFDVFLYGYEESTK